jgi:uncharacterized protein YdhG (YjbR/CyaY superfamily)
MIMKGSKDVAAYIARAPRERRAKLEEMRKAIRQVAPNSIESISYGMPGYDKGRIAWFGLMTNHIGLYLRPPIIAEHKDALAAYKTTKSAVQFPLDRKLPVALIKKLVRARMKGIVAKWRVDIGDFTRDIRSMFISRSRSSSSIRFLFASLRVSLLLPFAHSLHYRLAEGRVRTEKSVAFETEPDSAWCSRQSHRGTRRDAPLSQCSSDTEVSIASACN